MGPDEAARKEFAKRGFGGEIGFGARPALLVIDFVNAFTDPEMPLGSVLDSEVENCVEVLEAARAAEVPIIFTSVTYEEKDLADAGLWVRKIGGNPTLRAGTPAVELDVRLERRPEEQLLNKKYASSFFGTDLLSRLLTKTIDTVLIAGCTTSGCVRATAVDAIQLGLRPLVISDAVGDRLQAAHEQSLFDLEQKYADVTDKNGVIDYISTLKAKAGV